MDNKVIKSPFNEKNVATTKRKENSNKDLITRLNRLNGYNGACVVFFFEDG